MGGSQAREMAHGAPKGMSFLPLPLPLSPTVGGAVGGIGSRATGPEPQAGRVSPGGCQDQGALHTQEPTSYFPEQMEVAEMRVLPFLPTPQNTVSSCGKDQL